MEAIFDSIRLAHIVIGFTGLAAFWVPVLSRKGGEIHRKAGYVFEWSAYFITASAVFNALGRGIVAILGGAPLAGNEQSFGFLLFLAYLGIVTFAAVRHGVLSIRRKDLLALRSPFHMGIAVASILGSVLVVAYALAVWSDVSIVLLALSPIGVVQGREMIAQMTRPQTERMAWYYAHMGNMLGAGIAFHTAFAVFGSNRIFDYELPGAWRIVPWILPAAIGMPAGYVLESKYRRRFGEPRRGKRREATASA